MEARPVPSSGSSGLLKRSKSTPDFLKAATATPSTPPPKSSKPSSSFDSTTTLQASVTGADMQVGKQGEMVVYYQISVVMTSGQELGGARRRYREFLRLYRLLQSRYPRLLADDVLSDALPPIPSKTLFRPGAPTPQDGRRACPPHPMRVPTHRTPTASDPRTRGQPLGRGYSNTWAD